MPGSMAPLQKPRHATRMPLALNPLKSKDVLAVLAERNQAVMPVGAWVEAASPDSSEVPAYTSAYMIEEELKEQLRKKQEALKHFQRQVKHRVNQQIRLRKKQQLQRSYEAAEKEGSIAMQSSDPAHLTPKKTSVFSNNLNAAIGSARLPPSQMLGDGIDDRENQNELFQQQAQALSQTMKQARHRLASFKTVNKKNASMFPDGRRKTFPPQEEPDSEESSSTTVDKRERENLFWGQQQDLLSEDREKPFSRVQKVQFKNPLFAVVKEEEQKQLDLQDLQDILPEAQDYLAEAQGDLLETRSDLTGVQNVELEAESVEPRLSIQPIDPENQAVEPEAQAIEPKVQAVKIETQGILPEAQNIELEDESIMSKVQDLLPKEQSVLPKDQNILPRCQDQDFLLKDQDFLPKDQNILPRCRDQDFLPKDQHFLPRDQKAGLKQGASILLGPRGREAFPLAVHQDLQHRHQDQATIMDKKVRFKESYSDMSSEEKREGFSVAGHQYLPPKLQDQTFIRDQSKYIKQPSSFEKWEIERRLASGVPPSLCFRQQPSVGTSERWQEDLRLDDHQHLPPKHQREASSRRQVYDEYQSRLNTEFQTPLTFQSGVDQEEDKKERQKQYLRYRRLFMDIEREQVKEQQRQKEHQKKVEKIKKKKEQQRYAEEQRILRMNFHEEPYSEKMSEILAQLQLEEIKGAREKQQQRKKECQRYMEALRAQIQEKMRLYNITLPPLCCCGPDFWDAHPDTCANNCIFYKNHRAYTRALHSVINSCDIPEGTSTLRVAMHNLASAHRRTLKNL
ncbi:coiled-coil domain-containing protein 15 isoform X1 [Vulpes vulpes]|uniref:Coiled-coil domain-containing protein 15 isoform X1 n=1 Tax=Vulpes vulpes TaxID=9627 RepID=A0A3Q7SHG1_VULVU|nr:coiled-coil domain-containing protein 15 isoform X1 [Vulpes vulpes]XP_025854762.1 coiled-coil domain-containing protein 15 isoform X1 [Vulpes vulpes]